MVTEAWLLIQAHRDRCVICGEDRAAALDFHHVDPATKSFNLGSAAKSKSVDAVLREIAKCVVLCATCHRLIHAGELELPEKGGDEDAKGAVRGGAGGDG